MLFLLEESTTEKVPPLLDEIVKNLISQNISQDSAQKDFMFILIVILMKENGFLPLNDEMEPVDPVDLVTVQQLSKWKSNNGILQATFVMTGFKNIHLKLIMSTLGATVLVNLVINELNSETYSVCLPLSRYVASPHASTIPMIFRNLKSFSSSFKNKILTPVKSRILREYGYVSASLLGLPDEVICKIALHLPVKDVAALSKTCTKINVSMNSDNLWHNLCKRDFSNLLENDRDDWKAQYIELYVVQMEKLLRQTRHAGGALHDFMDYSDYVSHIDNPMWDAMII